jgi:hypothetical protein
MSLLVYAASINVIDSSLYDQIDIVNWPRARLVIQCLVLQLQQLLQQDYQLQEAVELLYSCRGEYILFFIKDVIYYTVTNLRSAQFIL